EFALDKETFYAFLFGHHAKLTYVSPFLDKIIGNGARKLKDAADQRGDVLANLNAAAGYKTVRRAILAASKYNNAKAEKLLAHQTPLGLSKELAASLIGDARRALAHAARKSKIYGLAAGLALAAALLGGYFFVPLRPHLT